MSNTNETKAYKSGKLQAITSSRFFWAIVSILAALLLWTYVTSTEGVEMKTSLSGIKVEFLGAESMREANGLIVTEQDNTKLNVTLSGARRVLTKLNSSNVTAVVDLSDVISDGRYSVSYDLSFPQGVSRNDVSIEHCSTDVINFYVDKLTTKTVLMDGVFSGNTAEGYLADETLVIDPVGVKISGPKTIINQVDRGFVSIKRENVDKSLQFSTTYDLLDSEGNIVDDDSIVRETEEVTVTLNVLSTKSVPLDVNIVDGGGATREDNTNITINPAYITLAGDAELVDSVNRILLGTIDLADFATDYSNTFPIVPPNDVENLTGITEASVTVSVTGLATKTFVISDDNISCINAPEGFLCENITKTLTVTIRGPEEVLPHIQESKLRAVADLKDLDLSSGSVYTPYVKVYIDGFPEVGVIGNYKIYVSVIAE